MILGHPLKISLEAGVRNPIPESLSEKGEGLFTLIMPDVRSGSATSIDTDLITVQRKAGYP